MSVVFYSGIVLGYVIGYMVIPRAKCMKCLDHELQRIINFVKPLEVIKKEEIVNIEMKEEETQTEIFDTQAGEIDSEEELTYFEATKNSYNSFFKNN